MKKGHDLKCGHISCFPWVHKLLWIIRPESIQQVIPRVDLIVQQLNFKALGDLYRSLAQAELPNLLPGLNIHSKGPNCWLQLLLQLLVADTHLLAVRSDLFYIPSWRMLAVDAVAEDAVMENMKWNVLVNGIMILNYNGQGLQKGAGWKCNKACCISYANKNIIKTLVWICAY